jgi:hypothetical protein
MLRREANDCAELSRDSTAAGLFDVVCKMHAAHFAHHIIYQASAAGASKRWGWKKDPL